jgi:hypothetical protein
MHQRGFYFALPFLIQSTNVLAPVWVDLFDEGGIGGGASGASGGLLHPYNPKGC